MTGRVTTTGQQGQNRQQIQPGHRPRAGARRAPRRVVIPAYHSPRLFERRGARRERARAGGEPAARCPHRSGLASRPLDPTTCAAREQRVVLDVILVQVRMDDHLDVVGAQAQPRQGAEQRARPRRDLVTQITPKRRRRARCRGARTCRRRQRPAETGQIEQDIVESSNDVGRKRRGGQAGGLDDTHAPATVAGRRRALVGCGTAGARPSGRAPHRGSLAHPAPSSGVESMCRQ